MKYSINTPVKVIDGISFYQLVDGFYFDASWDFNSSAILIGPFSTLTEATTALTINIEKAV